MRSYMKYSPNLKGRIPLLYGISLTAVAAALLLGLLLGATPIAPASLWTCTKDSPEGRILLYVRLPRVLGGLLCGAALSVSGAVIQKVLANRLASPGVIGVNAGAGLAVTLASAFGIMGGWRLSLFSFLGAFAAVMLVSAGAKKWGASRGTVLLMGVAMNSLLGAMSDAVTILIPEISILRNEFRLGDFSAVTYYKLLPAAVVILLSLGTLLSLLNELDVLALGENNARGLGLPTQSMRVLLLLLAAALAGAAVSVAGLLSFVGLMVPHAVRRVAGNEARHLLPLSALFGAAFVTLCDTLSRVAFAPYELPVGIFMAFLGAPFFLFLLIRKKGGHADA